MSCPARTSRARTRSRICACARPCTRRLMPKRLRAASCAAWASPPPPSWGRWGGGPPERVGSAKKLLAEAGSPDGFEVDFACPNNRYINDEAVCQAVTAMWSRVGVKARLRTLPLATYFPMIQRYEASIYMLGWGVPTFDALYSLQSLVRTVGTGGDGNYNLGRYSNQRMDYLVD